VPCGASVNFTAKHVIITSNTHPNAWWQQGLRAMERRLDPPIGSVTEMLTGVWEPPASSVPHPLSLDASREREREGTPQMAMIASGSSMRPAISCGSSAAGLFSLGDGVSEREDVQMTNVFAHMSMPASTTMESGLMLSRESSPPLAAWQMTRQWRTPSPSIMRTTLQSPTAAMSDHSWWNHN